MLGESVRRRQPVKRAGRQGRRRGWRRWLPWALALLLLPFAIGYLVAVQLLFPAPEIAAAGIEVPDLTGGSIGDAERALAAVGLGRTEATGLPHPSAPRGQVTAQSPLPGQQLRAGANVRVALSTGVPRGVIPDVVGFPEDRATALLDRLGLETTRSEQESSAAAGRVIAVSPQPGSEVALPSTVTLVVSTGPAIVIDSFPPLPNGTDSLPGIPLPDMR